MFKKIVAIVFIYLFTVIAWMALGGSITIRSNVLDSKLRSEVTQLWGNIQKQTAPQFCYFEEKIEKVEIEKENKEKVIETRKVSIKHDLPISSSDIQVDLNLDYRQKGLLWYSTYRVKFEGKYTVSNNFDTVIEPLLTFYFPNPDSIYDDFKLIIGGIEVEDIDLKSGKISQEFMVAPGNTETIEISYISQGLDEWWYIFGENVSQVRNFSMVMKTDFKEIDFPQNSISPTEKNDIGNGKLLTWKYVNLLSGAQLAMKLPRRLNPGPWAGKVTYWAWVSLFLFFFLVFIISIIKEIKIHPMHYLFIAAAYFSFHLLLAYLVDHISIHLAFIICSAVSLLLVFTYMRLIIGARKAFFAIGLSQFAYLVIFSYTFFFEKFTGLAITILCIITLFFVMQFTAHIDWESAFSGKPRPDLREQ